MHQTRARAARAGDRVTAPHGGVTSLVYDDLGNLRQEQSPDRGSSLYSYDRGGNRTQSTDARGITVAYSYDALNRLQSADYPGSAEDIGYQYDT